MWELQHPEGRAEINELHVPLGQAVKLTMTSQDVIHSFFVPAFRIKQDVLPGRYTIDLVPADEGRAVPPVLRRVLRHEPLEDDRLGRRDGAGRLRAVAVGRGESGRRWPRRASGCSSSTTARAATGAARSSTPRGSKASTASRCRSRRATTCASSRPTTATSATRSSCPSREVVAGYEPVMPSFQGQISEEDLLKIIAYIKSIGHKEAGR